MKKGFKYEYKHSRTYTDKMAEHLDAVRPKAGSEALKQSTGRPTKEEAIKAYRKEHPNAIKTACSKELGISYPTVCKWWNF